MKENENTAIGQISISRQPETIKWSTAFWISDKYQNSGYAKEALLALTEKISFNNEKIQF